MAHVEHKKVDLVELFFDLVMVCAVSQTTGLICRLHGGAVYPWSLASFALAYVILVGAWVYQVVFTNRFGETSAGAGRSCSPPTSWSAASASRCGRSIAAVYGNETVMPM